MSLTTCYLFLITPFDKRLVKIRIIFLKNRPFLIHFTRHKVAMALKQKQLERIFKLFLRR